MRTGSGSLNRSRTLDQLLDDAADFLSDYAEGYWPTVLRRYAEESRQGHDVKAKIHGLFGGMGSLNDLWLCELNGHAVSKEEEKNVNAAFAEVRDRVWYAVSRTSKS